MKSAAAVFTNSLGCSWNRQEDPAPGPRPRDRREHGSSPAQDVRGARPGRPDGDGPEQGQHGPEPRAQEVQLLHVRAVQLPRMGGGMPGPPIGPGAGSCPAAPNRPRHETAVDHHRSSTTGSVSTTARRHVGPALPPKCARGSGPGGCGLPPCSPEHGHGDPRLVRGRETDEPAVGHERELRVLGQAGMKATTWAEPVLPAISIPGMRARQPSSATTGAPRGRSGSSRAEADVVRGSQGTGTPHRFEMGLHQTSAVRDHGAAPPCRVTETWPWPMATETVSRTELQHVLPLGARHQARPRGAGRCP